MFILAPEKEEGLFNEMPLRYEKCDASNESSKGCLQYLELVIVYKGMSFTHN